MKKLKTNLMKNLKDNLLRGIAVLLVAMLLTAMTACTDRQVDTVIDVIEIAGDLASSDSTPADETTSSEAPNEADSASQDVSQSASSAMHTEQPAAETASIDEDGSYTSKEDVALYIHSYGHLPDNFITKKEAEKLGWPGGNLEPYAPGKCIGGSHYGNYEGLLPEKKGRSFTECDIDTLGAKKRGAKRIIFSNDGLIYYTADHYETFELLYGEP